MGQKVNSIIFRQPYGNPQPTLWFSKFDRYSQFLSQDIEVRNFLTFLLDRKGIILKSSSLERTSQQIVLNLDLYFSVFLTKRSKSRWVSAFFKKLKSKYSYIKRLKYVRGFPTSFEPLEEEEELFKTFQKLKKGGKSPLLLNRRNFKVSSRVSPKKSFKINLKKKLSIKLRKKSFKTLQKKFSAYKKFKESKSPLQFLVIKNKIRRKKIKVGKPIRKPKTQSLSKKPKKKKVIKNFKRKKKLLKIKDRAGLTETLSYERRLLFFLIFKRKKKYLLKRKQRISIISVLKKSHTPKLLRVKMSKFKSILKTQKFIYNYHKFNCIKSLNSFQKIKSLTFFKLNKFLCEFLQRFIGTEHIKIRFYSTQLKFLPFFKLFKKKVMKRLSSFKRNRNITNYFKESLEILFFAFTMFSFGNAMLISKLIGRLLETTRKQIVIIKFLKKIMAIYFRRLPSNFCGLNGMKIMIVGRFNKRPRTKTIILQQGQICLQTLSMPIDFHYRQVVTLYGSFGVKVWLSKKSKETKKLMES